MGNHSWIGKPGWRSFAEPSWLMHKGLAQAVSRWAEDACGDVVDYGCGEAPYRSLFLHCKSYVAADFPSNSSADICYQPDGRLPLSDSSVDVILSTQVLEHVRDPGFYLAECHRVLKPKGRLLLSTHGFFMWHGPGDWRRWTHEGLIYEVESAGFDAIDLDAICILRAFFLQFMNYTVFSRLLRHRVTYPLGAALVMLTNALGAAFPGEILLKSAKERTHLPFCYLIVAQRR
jgi:SAM-dependent methyltransferase